MNRFFGMDSPIMRFLERIGDLFVLNILVLLCCIPIFTIGTAFTALYDVTLRMAEGKEGYIFRGYLMAFKNNFKQSTLIWLIMLVPIILLVGDVIIITRSGIVFGKPMLIAFFAVVIILMMAALYIFPQQARFENSIRNIYKNAFIIAFARLPLTLLIVLIHIAPFVLCYFFAMAVPLVMILGISAVAYASSFVFLRAFKIFEKSNEKEDTSDAESEDKVE